jgi:small subunit ribosomal protein S17
MAESAAATDQSEAGEEAASHSNPRTASGTVTSNRMDKTITVRVERRVQHPVYGKIIRRSSKVHAHDENNECNEGDWVTVIECRPLSKTKTWMLKSIDERAREV